tara:strand:- start:469 stop:996 length:528 start_codon:yes stop_codon:yes gene_type:complete
MTRKKILKKSNLVHIGTFSQPLGLKGEIKIIMLTTSFDAFKSYKPYLKEGGKDIWSFSYLRQHKGKIIAKVENCESRSEVEKVKGTKIFTNKKNLPKTKKDQFYISEIINLKVKNLNDKILGKVIDINNFGAGDLINVENSEGKSFFIPMDKENVIDINLKKKIIIVNPIKGIID